MTDHDLNMCMELCKKCADACEACAIACEKEANPALRSCIELDMDCADFCRLTASFIARRSDFTELVCQDCAEICTACAVECEQHGFGHCRTCAEACRRCAEECLKVGAAAFA